MELLDKLGINVSLLIAQVVNFAILVSVLGYLVYRPLLKVIDARRERIRTSMEEAKRMEHQVKEMEQVRLLELKKIDEECGAFLQRSMRQAEQIKEEILISARKEAESLLARGRQQIRDDRARMLSEAQAMLASVIVSATEKILAREFTSSDQKRIAASLTKDLPSLLS